MSDEAPDLPARPMPPGLPATVVQKRAAVERKAMTRQAHMEILVPGVDPITREQFLARSQAWLDDIQLRVAEEDLPAKDVALLATAWRKFASLHVKAAGWERDAPALGLQVNVHNGTPYHKRPNPKRDRIIDAIYRRKVQELDEIEQEMEDRDEDDEVDERDDDAFERGPEGDDDGDDGED